MHFSVTNKRGKAVESKSLNILGDVIGIKGFYFIYLCFFTHSVVLLYHFLPF